MWTFLAFLSALCLGCYDISKKIALRSNTVVDVLAVSVCISACILCIPLLLSRIAPEAMLSTHFWVPALDGQAHLLTALKSVIVLSSWIFAYLSLKHLPISVVSPVQATRPMWTLVGALVLFNEQLNSWQWAGVLIAIGTIFSFSFTNRRHLAQKEAPTKYYVFLALAVLTGACSGLYDKYLMRRYDHNAVQVYYTMYQALMMIAVWCFMHRKELKNQILPAIQWTPALFLISIFLIISDNVYMQALRDPDSLIAVVSTIRRGGTVLGFAYGLICLKEKDPLPKILCMAGICAGLLCLAIGSA